MKLTVALIACSGALIPGAAIAEAVPPVPEPEQSGPFAPGQQQLVRRQGELPYGPCPPTLPKGCEMAVLEGNPRLSGLFTLRIRTSEPFVMPPHTHPRAERVTVLEGEIHVGFGTAVDKGIGNGFYTGDYYVNAPGAVHFVWSDKPTTIQITGQGPWEVHPYKAQ